MCVWHAARQRERFAGDKVMDAIADAERNGSFEQHDLLVFTRMDMHWQGRAQGLLGLPYAEPPVALGGAHWNDDPRPPANHTPPGTGGFRSIAPTLRVIWESAFVWLHSMDAPALAIPVTNPWRFFEDYAVERRRRGRAHRRHGPRGCLGLLTVRSAPALEDFCANLRAPILVVGNEGHQIINQAPDCPVRAPLFADLKEEPSKAA